MSMLRTFIAIELPGDLQIEISQIIGRLQNKAGKSGVRWVSAENIHLTLKFLGDVSSSAITDIQELLKLEAAHHHPFTATIGGVGAFPNQKRPRIIWLGVNSPPELASLQHGIESALAKLGYLLDERPFSPHLTLGRVRENASTTELAALASALKDIQIGILGKVTVDNIHLFKSDLQPGGSVYTRLCSAQLSHSN
jgi:2'-5' RNA ligase